MERAEELVGVPFVDGGRDPGKGLDCWGLVREAYKRITNREMADFDIAEGDTLVLREYDPDKKDYTGREIEKRVTMVLKTRGNDWHNHTPEEIAQYGW